MWKTHAVSLFMLIPLVAIGQEKKDAAKDKETFPDAEVLEVVLIDLLTCKESPVVSRNRGLGSRIVFSDVPYKGEPLTEKLERIDDKSQLKTLSKKQLASMEEGVADMVRRAKQGLTFESFKPKGEQIVLHTKKDREKEVGKDRLDQPQVFSAFAPGYSKDKKFAMVWLTFPWSIHHGDVTYLLENVDEKWIVRLRDVRIYL